MEERRYKLRVKDKFKVEYRAIGRLRASGTVASEVSEGGLRLYLFDNLNPGIKLKLKIFSQTKKIPVVATAEIVWIRPNKTTSAPYVAGAKITEMQLQDHRELIHSLLSSLCNQR